VLEPRLLQDQSFHKSAANTIGGVRSFDRLRRQLVLWIDVRIGGPLRTECVNIPNVREISYVRVNLQGCCKNALQFAKIHVYLRL
jgi:hypothetical protein